MSYAKDFVKCYMELLPRDGFISGPNNTYLHKTIALTVGGALQLVLAKFKYDLLRELDERK